MSDNEFVRQVPLHCPTCGATDFLVNTDDGSLVELVECTNCRRSMLKDELLRENSENVELHVAELTAEISDYVRKRIQRVFRHGSVLSSNVRFK